MRITRDLLLKNAERHIQESTMADSSIVAAYLSGSVAMGEPLLGETTDIDLIYIHLGSERPPEVLRLTNEVHLDIRHDSKESYEAGRDLRQDAWMGWKLFNARPMYDPQHFFDFTQANVRGLFDTPENIIARAQPLLDAARSAWFEFYNQRVPEGPRRVQVYLQALADAANSVAVLNGAPLTDRRFLMEFPARAEKAGQPGLAAGLLGLLGANETDTETIKSWLPRWGAAYAEVLNPTINLHRDRVHYHRAAILALMEGKPPQAALWPLLRTWTEAATLLPPAGESLEGWEQAVTALKLYGTAFAERVEGLDAYLDSIEELLEGWRGERGLE